MGNCCGTQDTVQSLSNIEKKMIAAEWGSSDASTAMFVRPMGFRNFATNCFMNTALQCIAYLEPFQRFFTLAKIDEILGGENGELKNGELPGGKPNSVEPTEHFRDFLEIRESMLKATEKLNDESTVPYEDGSAFHKFEHYVRHEMGFPGQEDADEFLTKFIQEHLSSLRPTTTLFPPRELIWPTRSETVAEIPSLGQVVALSRCEEEFLRVAVDICRNERSDDRLAAWSCETGEAKVNAETVVQNLQLKAGERRVLLAGSPVGRFLKRVQYYSDFSELDTDNIENKGKMCALFIASMDENLNAKQLKQHKAFLDSDPLHMFQHLEVSSKTGSDTRTTEISSVVTRQSASFNGDGSWKQPFPESRFKESENIPQYGWKELEYVNFGDILVVNVKRADWSSEDMTRLNFKVRPEETLKLPVYGTKEATVNQTPTRYDVYKLKSIGLNSGNGAQGHWWAMAKVPSPKGNGRWWKLDDEIIGPTHLSEIDQSHVTLMFYVREPKGNQADEEE